MRTAAFTVQIRGVLYILRVRDRRKGLLLRSYRAQIPRASRIIKEGFPICRGGIIFSLFVGDERDLSPLETNMVLGPRAERLIVGGSIYIGVGSGTPEFSVISTFFTVIVADRCVSRRRGW